MPIHVKHKSTYCISMVNVLSHLDVTNNSYWHTHTFLTCLLGLDGKVIHIKNSLVCNLKISLVRVVNERKVSSFNVPVHNFRLFKFFLSRNQRNKNSVGSSAHVCVLERWQNATRHVSSTTTVRSNQEIAGQEGANVCLDCGERACACVWSRAWTPDTFTR